MVELKLAAIWWKDANKDPNEVYDEDENKNIGVVASMLTTGVFYGYANGSVTVAVDRDISNKCFRDLHTIPEQNIERMVLIDVGKKEVIEINFANGGKGILQRNSWQNPCGDTNVPARLPRSTRKKRGGR